jgi:hypothetical protein
MNKKEKAAKARLLERRAYKEGVAKGADREIKKYSLWFGLLPVDIKKALYKFADEQAVLRDIASTASFTKTVKFDYNAE